MLLFIVTRVVVHCGGWIVGNVAYLYKGQHDVVATEYGSGI